MAPSLKRTSLAAAMFSLYKTAINIVTALQKRFTASMFARLTSARDAEAIASRAADRSEQFAIRLTGRSTDDATAASDCVEVPDDAPFAYHLNDASSRVSATPSCRLMQHVAVERALFENGSRRN